MSIVISPDIRLILATDNNTTLDRDVNEATELRILKDISVTKGTTSIVGDAGGVGTSINKVPHYRNTGYSGVSLQFSTYLKPVTNYFGFNVAAEQLLWESLSSTDVTQVPTSSTVNFTSGNSNQLRELFIYLVMEDGSYHVFNNAVVTGVEIEIDINQITMAKWSIAALSSEYKTSSPLTETSLNDFTEAPGLRNKLSTIALNLDSVDYNLAITSGNITISNDVVLKNRIKVGEISSPTGHYVSSRSSQASITCYLNTKSDGSSALVNKLAGFSNLTQINQSVNATIALGGSSNDLKVSVNIPTGKIVSSDPGVGLLNTMSFNLIPQESTLGAGDEINIVYDK